MSRLNDKHTAMTDRDHIPESVKRDVLVEAGHRCAIPTCRFATTELAHIVPWAKTQDDSFANLIALCPNCHTRYDRGEIDRLSMRMYKQNLSLLNSRYREFERRVFERVASTGERLFAVGPGGDLLVSNAVRDGLFETFPRPNTGLQVRTGHTVRERSTGIELDFYAHHAYRVTDAGFEFINRFARGEALS
jgi:hypothetical protein